MSQRVKEIIKLIISNIITILAILIGNLARVNSYVKEFVLKVVRELPELVRESFNEYHSM